MPLKPIPLKETELVSNYNYWMNKFNSPVIKPETSILSILREKICTTHSFPFTKNTPTGDVIPYETIFSDLPDNGILSNGLREEKNINPDDDKSSRNIPPGLKNYVFSYLGIHQPYYSRMQEDKLGLLSKPFGVFIKNPYSNPDLEIFPENHASRRDVGKDNDDVDQKNLDFEYLLPRDARLLMAYQICNDHVHKVAIDQIDCFWHYYGNKKYWADKDYADNSWKKKAEFRFFEKLELSEISAVLWPVWIHGSDEENEEYSRTHDDVQVYSKKYPDIKFITYDLDLRNPEICFVEASYIALEFYLKNNKFPEDISIAKNVLALV